MQHHEKKLDANTKKKGKWTCIAPIVSTSTTKRSDVDGYLQIHHICLSFV